MNAAVEFTREDLTDSILPSQYNDLLRRPSTVADGEYRPPSREYFDSIVSQLEVLLETKDLLGELQAEIEKGATVSPWVTPDDKPQEKPLTRLKAPDLDPEPEDEEDPSADTNPGIDLTHSSLPPSDSE